MLSLNCQYFKNYKRIYKIKSIRLHVFYWIGILKHLTKLTGMHQVESFFSNGSDHYHGHIYDTFKHLRSSHSAKIVKG